MIEFSPHEQLKQRCSTSDEYPHTLFTTRMSRTLLRDYHDYMKQNDAALFGGPKQQIVFRDLREGFGGKYQSSIEFK